MTANEIGVADHPDRQVVPRMLGSGYAGMSILDVAEPFATSLRAKATLLKSADLTKRQTSRLMESLSDDLKKFCDIVTPDLRPPMVSVAALEAARTIGVDLCRESWHGQNRFDKGRGRGTAVFHLEHVIPIASMRCACLDAPDHEGVVDVLTRQVRIAWILKSEDRTLAALGYRTKRDDPDGAYREAGIRLVSCHPATP